MNVNALDTCNACDAIGVDPNSPAGYCTTCEQIARIETVHYDIRGFQVARCGSESTSVVRNMSAVTCGQCIRSSY